MSPVSLTPALVAIDRAATALAGKVGPIRDDVTSTQRDIRGMYAKGAGPRVIPGTDPRLAGVTAQLRGMADALTGALRTSGLPATWPETASFVDSAARLRDLAGRVAGREQVNLHGLASQVGAAFDPVMRLHPSTIYDPTRATLSVLAGPSGRPRPATRADLDAATTALRDFASGFGPVTASAQAAARRAVQQAGDAGRFEVASLVGELRPAVRDALRGVTELRDTKLTGMRHGSEAWTDASELAELLSGVVSMVNAHERAGTARVTDPGLLEQLRDLRVYLDAGHFNSPAGTAKLESFAVESASRWAQDWLAAHPPRG